ncbi:MAG: hypothetical protein LDL37_06295 [Asticcacaulis sp.]|uniref:hypothetical protein n=1 Tax=Asticcacaulis sp. TaxID=1872648 RepID=UPI0025BD7E5C|nr:hypothetical protein [Asticcacaulis sp.]MCA1935043.1 hypothetical protein [Asticcacaulis sp.]
MRRFWVSVVLSLGVIAGFVVIGLYYVPDSARLRPADEAKWRALTLPKPYVEYACGDSIGKEERTECEANLSEYAPGNGFDLIFPQNIPDEDCALMATVLRDEAKAESDGEVYLNVKGQMNCPFSKYGLKHSTKHEPEGGYFIMNYYSLDERRVSADVFAFAYRHTYVSRPQYSLFRTRAVISYGHEVEAGSGYICTYNRFSGQWRREGTCAMSWVS